MGWKVKFDKSPSSPAKACCKAQGTKTKTNVDPAQEDRIRGEINFLICSLVDIFPTEIL